MIKYCLPGKSGAAQSVASSINPTYPSLPILNHTKCFQYYYTTYIQKQMYMYHFVRNKWCPALCAQLRNRAHPVCVFFSQGVIWYRNRGVQKTAGHTVLETSAPGGRIKIDLDFKRTNVSIPWDLSWIVLIYIRRI